MQLLLFVIVGKVLAIIAGIYFFKSLSLAYRLVFLQVVVAALCEVYGYYLSHILHEQNIWLFNIFWLAGETILMGIVGILLMGKALWQKISSILLLATVTVWLYNVTAFSINHYAPWVKLSIHTLMVVLYTIILFDKILFNSNKTMRQPDFWLCISALLFFGCNIPLYGLYNHLNTHYPEKLEQLFNISLVLNFIRYPLVAVSIFMCSSYSRQKFVRA